MTDRAPLTGGELNAAITRAMVGIQNKFLGRGPKSASTFYHDNIVVTLMYEVLNRAERELAQGDRGSDVTFMRQRYQETMEAEFTEAVERLTGRRVVAFISGNHAASDIASELFVLDAPIT